jgi:DNA adenine methylase
MTGQFADEQRGITRAMNTSASPIIPWIGGKRRLAARLLPLFPDHQCYVELFCGGAALFFLRQQPAQVEILNDINGELINLYRVVQNHLKEFIRQFEWALPSRQVFKWAQETRPETLTDIQRAARFYYLQHHAFSGKIVNQTFGTATTAPPAINHSRIQENLSAAHHRLATATIEHLPWGDCLRRYDRKHTFFYADPPYWQTEGYGVPFDFEQYKILAEAMHTVAGKIMVSINDHPDIRRVFANLKIYELDVTYSVASKSGAACQAKELCITNWDADEIGGLFG